MRQYNRLPFLLMLKLNDDAAMEGVSLSHDERLAILQASRDLPVGSQEEQPAPAVAEPAPIPAPAPTPAPVMPTPVTQTTPQSNVVAHTMDRSDDKACRLDRHKAAREGCYQPTTPDANAIERTVKNLQRTVEIASSERLYTVSYDIPDRSPVGNPSWLFWRLGLARFQLSCWLAHESTIQSPAFLAWVRQAEQHGCEVDIYVQHDECRERQLAKAKRNLDTAIREAHTSLITSIGNADDALVAAKEEADKLQSLGGMDEATKKRDLAVRGAINTAAKRLDSVIAAAQKFDDTEDVATLLEALREAIKSQAEAFNAAAVAKRIRRITL